MDPISKINPSADTSKDDWHNVSDAKKRKQIQDRLAQRARQAVNTSWCRGEHMILKRIQDRAAHVELNASIEFIQELALTRGPIQTGRRLRDARKDPQITRDLKITHDEMHVAHHPTPTTMNLPGYSFISGSEDTTISYSAQKLLMLPDQLDQPCLSYELAYPATVFSALFINGQIMGLACNSISPALSAPVSPGVPIPLHPTPSQLSIIHSTAWDRFPFPKMRDRAINLSLNYVIDEEDFGRDLFLYPSFTITPGAATWDPRAWKIEKPFAEKWGFLFC